LTDPAVRPPTKYRRSGTTTATGSGTSMPRIAAPLAARRRVGEQVVDLILVGLEDPDLHDPVAQSPRCTAWR
jgi:hypothetical protein